MPTTNYYRCDMLNIYFFKLSVTIDKPTRAYDKNKHVQ